MNDIYILNDYDKKIILLLLIEKWKYFLFYLKLCFILVKCILEVEIVNEIKFDFFYYVIYLNFWEFYFVFYDFDWYNIFDYIFKYF